MHYSLWSYLFGVKQAVGLEGRGTVLPPPLLHRVDVPEQQLRPLEFRGAAAVAVPPALVLLAMVLNRSLLDSKKLQLPERHVQIVQTVHVIQPRVPAGRLGVHVGREEPVGLGATAVREAVDGELTVGLPALAGQSGQERAGQERAVKSRETRYCVILKSFLCPILLCKLFWRSFIEKLGGISFLGGGNRLLR